MAEETPEGMVKIRFVTQYAVQVQVGFVQLGLRIEEPNPSIPFEPLEVEAGLEPAQARELANALHQAANQLLPGPHESP